MAKNVAVQGFTISLSGDVTYSPTAYTVVSGFNNNVLIDNKPVAAGALQLTIAVGLIAQGAYASTSLATFTINGTAKSSADGNALVLEGDKSSAVSVVLSNGESSTTVSITCSIASAGQTNVTDEGS